MLKYISPVSISLASFVGTFLLAQIGLAHAAPPPNDTFASATLLTGTEGEVVAPIVEATSEIGEPANRCGNRTVWYKWTAPAHGELNIWSGGYLYFFSCAYLYIGERADALRFPPGHSLSEAFSIQTRSIHHSVEVEPGSTFYVQVTAPDGPPPVNNDTATFTFSFTQPSVNIVSAVLPGARSVTVGTPATAYGTMINTSGSTLYGCMMALPVTVPAAFEYFAADAQNKPIAGLNRPFPVPANGIQNFIFAITPTAPINSQNIPIIFDCAGTQPATSISGLNTFLLSASSGPVPDMLTIAATTSNDGIITLPSTTGTHIFATATINIGAGDTLTASIDDNGRNLPVTMTACQTNAATGACINPVIPGSTDNISSRSKRHRDVHCVRDGYRNRHTI